VLKMISSFIVFFIIIHIAVMVWRDMTKQEKCSTLKGLTISSGVGCIIIVLLSLFVAVF